MTTETARPSSITETRFMDLMHRVHWTDDEGVELTVAFVASRGKDGASEDDIFKWFDYLEHLKVELAAASCVATGTVRMLWPDGGDEPHFMANETTPTP